MNAAFGRLLTDVTTQVLGNWLHQQGTKRSAEEIVALWGEQSAEFLFQQSMRTVATILARHGVTKTHGDTFGECSGLVLGMTTGSIKGLLTNLNIQNGDGGIWHWVETHDVDTRAEKVAQLVMQDLACGRTNFMDE